MTTSNGVTGSLVSPRQGFGEGAQPEQDHHHPVAGPPAERSPSPRSLSPTAPAVTTKHVAQQMGAIQLIAHQGSGWAPRKLPERLRATYSKNGGVRYVFGAYDVHADRLHGRLRPHKSGQDVLGFYRQIRMRYRPKIRIYLIADNLSAHKTPDIRQWAAQSNVELVFTPTYASFLNRIECHFWAIGEFVVNNADYPDWKTFKKAMADHIQYRNGPHRDQRLLKGERRLLIAA